jgi:hypothetical protein
VDQATILIKPLFELFQKFAVVLKLCKKNEHHVVQELALNYLLGFPIKVHEHNEKTQKIIQKISSKIFSNYFVSILTKLPFVIEG